MKLGEYLSFVSKVAKMPPDLQKFEKDYYDWKENVAPEISKQLCDAAEKGNTFTLSCDFGVKDNQFLFLKRWSQEEGINCTGLKTPDGCRVVFSWK